MSGGHFDYGYRHLEYLADDIEADFIGGLKYRGEYVPDKEQAIILAEINALIGDLRSCAKRAKELEWYMSGDTGATSYLDRISKL